MSRISSCSAAISAISSGDNFFCFADASLDPDELALEARLGEALGAGCLLGAALRGLSCSDSLLEPELDSLDDFLALALGGGLGGRPLGAGLAFDFGGGFLAGLSSLELSDSLPELLPDPLLDD